MLVVTGMHRSGTSAVSGLLAELGLDFGPTEDHLPADRWNERGYFEHKRVFALNTLLITGARAAAASWYLPSHARSHVQKLSMMVVKARYLLMPPTSILLRRAERFRNEMTEVGEEVQHLTVKDPRFCLLLAAWARYARVEKVLFCYREPAAVVRSLHTREGIPKWLARRFWAYHAEAFLEQAEGLDVPVFVVDYDALFSEGRGAEQAMTLFSFAGVAFDLDRWRAVSRTALDRELRHHEPSTEELPPKLVALDRKLRGLGSVRGRGTP